MPANHIFVNGEVITVNPENEIIEAAAVDGNRISAVGTNDEVLRHRGAKTYIIDLAGRVALPRFIDEDVGTS